MSIATNKEGMTLIEVMVVSLLSVMVIAGIITSIVFGSRMNYAVAQRVAAFGLCREWYEEMRGASYSNVTEAAYALETIQITHLGGTERLPLMGDRSCEITELNDPANPVDPPRKQVDIKVEWTYAGQKLEENLSGVIFRKR